MFAYLKTYINSFPTDIYTLKILLGVYGDTSNGRILFFIDWIGKHLYSNQF